MAGWVSGELARLDQRQRHHRATSTGARPPARGVRDAVVGGGLRRAGGEGGWRGRAPGRPALQRRLVEGERVRDRHHEEREEADRPYRMMAARGGRPSQSVGSPGPPPAAPARRRSRRRGRRRRRRRGIASLSRPSPSRAAPSTIDATMVTPACPGHQSQAPMRARRRGGRRTRTRPRWQHPATRARRARGVFHQAVQR
jgi:hypothetical protein